MKVHAAAVIENPFKMDILDLRTAKIWTPDICSYCVWMSDWLNFISQQCYT